MIVTIKRVGNMIIPHFKASAEDTLKFIDTPNDGILSYELTRGGYTFPYSVIQAFNKFLNPAQSREFEFTGEYRKVTEKDYYVGDNRLDAIVVTPGNSPPPGERFILRKKAAITFEDRYDPSPTRPPSQSELIAAGIPPGLKQLTLTMARGARPTGPLQQNDGQTYRFHIVGYRLPVEGDIYVNDNGFGEHIGPKNLYIPQRKCLIIKKMSETA